MTCEYVIDWQAWATFTTGVLAVGSAVVVGIRQNTISRRLAENSEKQTNILSRQVALEELTFRNDVFERRFKVYDAVSAFVRQIVQRADTPDDDVHNEFIEAMNQSVFLFDPTVNRKIERIWKHANRFFYLRRESTRLYNAEGHYGPFPYKEHRLLIWFSGRFQKLPEMFGNDLLLWHREQS